MCVHPLQSDDIAPWYRSDSHVLVMPNSACSSKLEIGAHLRYDGGDVMYRNY
jgi:hypothetical protein